MEMVLTWKVDDKMVRSYCIGNVYYNLIQMAEGAEIHGKLVHQPEGQVPLMEQTMRIDEKVAASGE